MSRSSVTFAQASPNQHGWGEIMDTTQRTDQQTSADRRRRELLEAADRVVLRDGPGASMNAIAAEAGITKPILYRHFGDKGGLYAALAKRHTDALLGFAAGRAGRARGAPGAGRVHARHLSRGDRGAASGLPVPDASGGGRQPRRPGLRRRQALRAAAAPHGRGAGRGHRGAGRSRAGQPAAGTGVGARDRRHDACRRGLVARRTAVLSGRVGTEPGRPAVGPAGGGRRPGRGPGF